MSGESQTLWGSATAMFGGWGSSIVATTDPSPAGAVVGIGGFLIGAAGLVTALAPIVKGFLADRSEERRAKFERHDMANRLNVIELKQQSLLLTARLMWEALEEDRAWIEKAHATHPELDLPHDFGKRLFDMDPAIRLLLFAPGTGPLTPPKARPGPDGCVTPDPFATPDPDA